MKLNFILIFVLSILTFSECATRDKVTYNIPADFPAARRKEIIGMCDKGKEIYKVHCAECHGIYAKGKDSVPNFTTTQMDNYSARFLRRDPRNHSVIQNMSPEQLNDVFMFLRFKSYPAKNASVPAKKL